MHVRASLTSRPDPRRRKVIHPLIDIGWKKVSAIELIRVRSQAPSIRRFLRPFPTPIRLGLRDRARSRRPVPRGVAT